jgi:hypothetical protein
MRYAIIFIALLFLTSCEEFDNRLHLINNSNKKIRYTYELMNINNTVPSLYNCDSLFFYKINPHKSGIIFTSNGWKHTLRDRPNQVLRVYVINEDTFQKYSTCDYVKGHYVVYRKRDSLHNYNACDIYKKQLFIKRFDLKYDDFEKLNWSVVYNEK